MKIVHIAALVAAASLACASEGYAQQLEHRYFAIRVVDTNDAPLACATVHTHYADYTTDRNGYLAFYEPGLMNQRIHLDAVYGSYEFPLGPWPYFSGQAIVAQEGGGHIIKATKSGIAPPNPCAGRAQDDDSWLLLRGTVPTPEEHFGILLVDSASSRPIVLAKVQSPKHSYYSDNQGLVAFFDTYGMSKSVAFQISAHGYAPKTLTLTTTPGTSSRAVVELTPLPDQVAQRLYRITGASRYRESGLLGEAAPEGLQKPQLNAFVTGQDSVQTAIYQGKLFWIWGDTFRLDQPLFNYKATGATSPLVDTLHPEVGINLEYFVDASGHPRQMAPASSVKDAPGCPNGGCFTWLDGLSVVSDAQQNERLFAHYRMYASETVEDPCPPPDTKLPAMKSQTVEKQHGIIEWIPTSGEFKNPRVLTSADAVKPAGATQMVSHEGRRYIYYANDVRVPADESSIVDPSKFEAFTPFDRDNPTQLERDAQQRVVYGWKPVRPLERPPLDQLACYTSPLPARDLLYGHERDLRGKSVYMAHSGTTVWNELRKRYVRIDQQIGGGISDFGEIWYLEADSPMGPWVYARKVVTHDKYSFYNPRHHPYFDTDGGKTIYFEATYTNYHEDDAVDMPYHEYNQVMYSLDLTSERMALPVAIYDRSAVGTQNDFVTKTGLRRGDGNPPVAFFAYDRQVNDTIPVYMESASCASAALEAGASARTEPLFYALPVGATSPSSDLIDLFEYTNAEGKIYSVDPGLSGTRRTLARVWKNPLATTLPVSLYLPEMIADAGSDLCTSALSGEKASVALSASASTHLSGTIVKYEWKWEGTSKLGSDVSFELSPGVHRVELITTDAAGKTSRDTLSVSVSVSAILQSIPGEDGWVIERTDASNRGGRINSTRRLTVGDDASDRQRKAIASFDTSVIPVGAKILSASIVLASANAMPTTLGAVQLELKNGVFGTSAALQAHDFEATASAWVATPMVFGGLIGASVPAEQLNRNGRTQLRISFALEDDDDGRASAAHIYAGEDASNGPRLSVTYAP